jgi:hypothetical protein
MTGRELMVRIASAIVFSGVTFFIFTYIPANLSWLAGGIFPSSGQPVVKQTLSSLVDPSKPTLGLFLVMLVFAGVLLRGTPQYGLMLSLNGLGFALYVYYFFSGGVLDLRATGSALGVSNVAISLLVNASTLMYLLLIPPLLTFAKGMMMLARGASAEG